MTALAPTRPAVRRTLLRLHRPALLVWAAFVVLVVGELLWVHLSGAPRDRACRRPGGWCSYTALTDVNNVMNLVGTVLTYAPCAVAAWAGGALVGRELESGTAKLAWTQAASPARWLTAKLTVAAVPLLTGGAVLAVVFDRVWSADRDVLVTNWSWDRVFVPRGPLLPALVLFALAAGVLAGLALGRTLPALGVALAATLLLRSSLRDLWQPLRGTLHGFRSLNLAATGMVLVLTLLATAAAYAVLRRRAV
ncbi:hypothetical protein ACFV2Z_15020 [Streptomyces sp. NPDC059688]|uniref:Uncharacterized protein n=2 Tax=Streptomyces TaxID=1883 RepID=A0ABV1UEF5_9ACTN|nr:MULTISPECIES: hypothetical protein [unclassified Streptomyces]OKJ73397.1 hypothetical protein AMK32_37320 [Streptomyces sp. CB01883]ROP52412.1 hypothetical protein EDD94_1877 [Streptomyces sp. PanSC9]UXY36563.1 hypothetical protein N8I86_18570 [Streptomyces sp. HUAS 14-6]